MHLVRIVTFLLGLSVMGLNLPAAAQSNGCRKGQDLWSALDKSYHSVSARMKAEGKDYDQAFVETQALAILYWQDAGHRGVQEGMVTVSLDQCKAHNGCGVPQPPEGSAFEALNQYTSHEKLYNYDMRDEPPKLTPALLAPDASMVDWAEQTLQCDTNLSPPPPPPPPKPTGVCVRGELLDNAIDRKLQEVLANPGTEASAVALMYLQAYSIHAWQERARAGATDGRVIWALKQCAPDECGEPAQFDTAPFGGLMAYSAELDKYKSGQRSTPPYPPTYKPEGKMLTWANAVIGCDWEEKGSTREMYGASSRNQRLLLANSDVEGDRSFFEDALLYGGPYLTLWWEHNKGLWSLQDRDWACENFGSWDRRCKNTEMWALDVRNAEYAAKYGNGNWNQPYQRSDANAGYKGTVPQPTYRPPSKEPRCYNQGDGTEKCFYD